jgi:hypothetical protein
VVVSSIMEQLSSVAAAEPVIGSYSGSAAGSISTRPGTDE